MNLMVDIETLGTDYNGVITQIGACYFDWSGIIGETFLQNIQIQSCLDEGLTTDAGAIKFWLEQTAKNGVPDWLTGALPLKAVINDFCRFNRKAETIWSHGFDQTILQAVGRKCGIMRLMPYRNLRDIRTLVSLSGVNVKKQELVAKKTHNGLDDCIYQVEYCVKCYKALGERHAQADTKAQEGIEAVADQEG